MSEQKTTVEFIVGTPEEYLETLVKQFDELVKGNPRLRKQRVAAIRSRHLNETEFRRLYEGKFEPVPEPAQGHIAIRPTSPRLDPMTGGPLPSREAELRWLSGFSSSATCMASRPALRTRSRGTRIGSPYVDFRIL